MLRKEHAMRYVKNFTRNCQLITKIIDRKKINSILTSWFFRRIFTPNIVFEKVSSQYFHVEAFIWTLQNWRKRSVGYFDLYLGQIFFNDFSLKLYIYKSDPMRISPEKGTFNPCFAKNLIRPSYASYGHTNFFSREFYFRTIYTMIWDVHILITGPAI